VGADAVGDDGVAVFGAENQVDVEAGERLWHRLGRPSGLGMYYGHGTQGAALGYLGVPRWGVGVGYVEGRWMV
jgi:hypothetical protein